MLGLFRKQNEAEITEIRRFLEAEFRKDIEGAGNRLSRTEDEIIDAAESLEKSVQELDSIESASQFTGNLKSKYCRKALQSLEIMTKPGPDYEEKKLFAESCSSALKEISDIDIKEFRHLGAFSVKMSKISSQVSQMNRLCSSYASSLKGSRLEDAYTAGTMSEGIRTKSDRIAAMEGEAETMKSSHVFLKSRSHSLRLELSEIGKKMEEIDGMASEMSESEKQKISIETALSTEFGSLERVMRKFMHDCEGLVEKNDVEIMKKYLNDAGDTFLHHDDGTAIRRNLMRIRDAITRGDFACDETEKIDRSIRSMDFFISMKERWLEIFESLDKFYKKMEDLKKPLVSRKNTIENEAENAELDAKHALESYNRKSAEIAEMKKDVASDIKNISSWMEKKCGRRITLKHAFDA